MKKNKKKLVKEQELEEEDLAGLSFERHELVRVFAVELVFSKVSFKQSLMDECYFRNCVFKNCDFTGANISRTNFQGADFIGCTFDYTTFHGTRIGLLPLSRNLPCWENTKMQLAKNLRMNYASIGDYEGVNFAIKIELSSTREHLWKAAFSNEGYYRGKKEYAGLGRASYFLKYVSFWFFDKLWGNGESPARMFISVPLILLIFAITNSLILVHPMGPLMMEVSSVFLAGGTSAMLGFFATSALTLFRYIVIGLFVSSLVRRISRR